MPPRTPTARHPDRTITNPRSGITPRVSGYGRGVTTPESTRADALAGRRGRPRDVDLDGRILTATVELLVERGYEQMTMDDVALHAGVSKATVYRRYASKEELATDALHHLYEAEVPHPDLGSLRADLKQVYGDALAFAASPQGAGLIRVAIAESCRDPRASAMFKNSLNRRRKVANECFDRAVARGEMRADADRGMVFDQLPGLMVLRALLDEPLPGLADVDALVEVTIRGVGL